MTKPSTQATALPQPTAIIISPQAGVSTSGSHRPETLVAAPTYRGAKTTEAAASTRPEELAPLTPEGPHAGQTELPPLPRERLESAENASVAELAHLLKGLGVRIGPVLHQRRTEPRGPATLGAGKLEELRQLLEAEREAREGPIVLVFDGELTPGQQRHLHREFQVEIIDRTQVILRVFGQRARTRTAQLEIELAELLYEAPRIRDEEAVGAKQAGGGGRAAKGHTSVELRKQQLRKRIAQLKQELSAAATMQQRRRKRRAQVSRVALLGYTNAGKSSWMRALTGADVEVKDALFATLDTTVRTLHPPTTPRIVIADTVGFLRRLPNHLLASFHSTLDEALDAELLIIVLDGSDPEWRTHLETTHDVLRAVDADDIPRWIIVNKRDRMTEEARTELSLEHPDAPCVSAQSSADVASVRRRITQFFEARLDEARLLVPFDKASLRAEIWDTARVLEEHSDEAGTHLRVLAEAEQLERWRAQLPRRPD